MQLLFTNIRTRVGYSISNTTILLQLLLYRLYFCLVLLPKTLGFELASLPKLISERNYSCQLLLGRKEIFVTQCNSLRR